MRSKGRINWWPHCWNCDWSNSIPCWSRCRWILPLQTSFQKEKGKESRQIEDESLSAQNHWVLYKVTISMMHRRLAILLQTRCDDLFRSTFVNTFTVYFKSY